MEVYNSSFSAEDLEKAIKAVPSIGDNGNWYIGDIDTGVKARGPEGPKGDKGDAYILSEADKLDITNIVLAQLPIWTGGNY